MKVTEQKQKKKGKRRERETEKKREREGTRTNFAVVERLRLLGCLLFSTHFRLLLHALCTAN